jgi:hypothetical protein
MIKRSLLISILLLANVSNADVCSQIEGAIIIANDGQYLGKITNEYDNKSVLNEYGKHGGEYSNLSIWNEYGKYGGEYSDLSPFNSYSSNPPLVIKNGKAIAHLTTNKYVKSPLNPYIIKTCGF